MYLCILTELEIFERIHVSYKLTVSRLLVVEFHFARLLEFEIEVEKSTFCGHFQNTSLHFCFSAIYTMHLFYYTSIHTYLYICLCVCKYIYIYILFCFNLDITRETIFKRLNCMGRALFICH